MSRPRRKLAPQSAKFARECASEGDPSTAQPSARRKVMLGGGKSACYPDPSSTHASAVMRGNRKRDTTPELAIRRALHRSGLRYRLHVKLRVTGATVRPDVVFVRQRLAIFVDGCFWHGCPTHGTAPRANANYWALKIQSNRQRDRRNTEALREAGWTVIRAWEHEDPASVLDRVLAVFEK
jgi:DNA mismatch endonuclease, patch repair protein